MNGCKRDGTTAKFEARERTIAKISSRFIAINPTYQSGSAINFEGAQERTREVGAGGVNSKKSIKSSTSNFWRHFWAFGMSVTSFDSDLKVLILSIFFDFVRPNDKQIQQNEWNEVDTGLWTPWFERLSPGWSHPIFRSHICYFVAVHAVTMDAWMNIKFSDYTIQTQWVWWDRYAKLKIRHEIWGSLCSS